jgi:hypothetical protein
MSSRFAAARAKTLQAIVHATTEKRGSSFAIKAAVVDPGAGLFAFSQQKTMYGGKHVAVDAEIFVFASENEGGAGLVARGIVTSAEANPRKVGVARQTPRVSVTIRRIALAKHRLGRSELKRFSDWNDKRPETELNSSSVGKPPTRSLVSQMRLLLSFADSSSAAPIAPNPAAAPSST